MAGLMSVQPVGLLRLHVAAEGDPGVLARVLERFQNLNVVPRRVIAEFGAPDALHIQVDICGLTEARLSIIVARIAQVPSILNAYWHHV